MRIRKPADLARLVKTRRQAQGLTQQDVADAAGITRQSLARIEQGHGGASFDTVLRILENLGVRLETASSSGRNDPAQFLRWDADALRTVPASAPAVVQDTVVTASEPGWKGVFNAQTAHLREAARQAGFELSPEAARKALLNAAVETGDPRLEELRAGAASGDVERD